MESTASHPGRKHKVAPEDIVQHSWNLFNKNGYSSTTMAEIADGVGISRRSLFNYFPQKEALLFPGINLVLDAVAEALMARPQEESFLVSIESCLDLMDQASKQAESLFPPSQEIGRAQQLPASASYIRELSSSRMRTVALERFSEDPHVDIKAGLVAAITAQILTEAFNLAPAESASSQSKNVKLVLKQLSELFS